MSQSDKTSVSAKTEKLNQLVGWFDSDEFELELALEKFSQAEKLAEQIEKDLLQLKNTITVTKNKFNEAE